jgi:hypothetical protein
MVTMNSRFKRSAHIIFKDLEGVPALIDPYRRTVVKLNSVSCRIWELLGLAHPVSGIIDAIAEEFDAPREEIYKDVSNVLSGLLKREMIT